MRQAVGGAKAEEVTPREVNVRTRVHEYGGGAVCIHDGTVYYSSFADQRLYKKDIVGGESVALSPEMEGPLLRYADASFDATRGNLVLVREDHRAGEKEPVNEVVAVSAAEGGEGRVLATGADFYCAPRVSPDGKVYEEPNPNPCPHSPPPSSLSLYPPPSPPL